MQNILSLLKAPQHGFQYNGITKFFSLFKYEIIKILVFLLLFFASLYYVNAESKDYYGSKTPPSEKF